MPPVQASRAESVPPPRPLEAHRRDEAPDSDDTAGILIPRPGPFLGSWQLGVLAGGPVADWYCFGLVDTLTFGGERARRPGRRESGPVGARTRPPHPPRSAPGPWCWCAPGASLSQVAKDLGVHHKTPRAWVTQADEIGGRRRRPDDRIARRPSTPEGGGRRDARGVRAHAARGDDGDSAGPHRPGARAAESCGCTSQAGRRPAACASRPSSAGWCSAGGPPAVRAGQASVAIDG